MPNEEKEINKKRELSSKNGSKVNIKKENNLHLINQQDLFNNNDEEELYKLGKEEDLKKYN